MFPHHCRMRRDKMLGIAFNYRPISSRLRHPNPHAYFPGSMPRLNCIIFVIGGRGYNLMAVWVTAFNWQKNILLAPCFIKPRGLPRGGNGTQPDPHFDDCHIPFPSNPFPNHIFRTDGGGASCFGIWPVPVSEIGLDADLNSSPPLQARLPKNELNRHQPGSPNRVTTPALSTNCNGRPRHDGVGWN